MRWSDLLQRCHPSRSVRMVEHPVKGVEVVAEEVVVVISKTEEDFRGVVSMEVEDTKVMVGTKEVEDTKVGEDIKVGEVTKVGEVIRIVIRVVVATKIIRVVGTGVEEVIKVGNMMGDTRVVEGVRMPL